MFNIYSSNALGNPSNCTYPIICTITDISSLTEAVSHDYVCAEYKGGYRSSGNFIQSNCIPFDCDNDHSDNPADWITPDDVSRAFPCVTFAVHYSRNHMKQKGGKAARPKFHVLFPVPAIYSSKEYSELKRKIHDAFPYFDNNALDSARFFFGTDSPEVELYMGNITILDFINDSDTDTTAIPVLWQYIPIPFLDSVIELQSTVPNGSELGFIKLRCAFICFIHKCLS